MNNKQKLDIVFSQFVRLTYSISGYARCYTCGKLVYWTQIQNGHFIGRRYLSTRFNVDNCRPQCYDCNCLKDGNIPEYRIHLIHEIGIDKVLELERMKNDYIKFSDSDYKSLIKEYTKKVKILKSEL